MLNLAEQAYAAFAAHREAMGQDVPPWDKLAPMEQASWRAAANRIRDLLVGDPRPTDGTP